MDIYVLCEMYDESNKTILKFFLLKHGRIEMAFLSNLIVITYKVCCWGFWTGLFDLNH